MCDISQSASTTIDSGGGTLTTPDGAVSIDIPPGALGGPTSVSITEGVQEFKVGATQPILRIALGPAGKTFALPVTITLAWNDADNDGNVDGFFPALAESGLKVWRDGPLLAGPCSDPAFQALTCTTACCDVDANTWTLVVSGFSEFAVGRAEFTVVSGKLLVVKDKGRNPTKRRVVVVSRDPGIVTPPTGSAEDPTLSGGQLFLVNPATAEADLFNLPASGWKARHRGTAAASNCVMGRSPRISSIVRRTEAVE